MPPVCALPAEGHPGDSPAGQGALPALPHPRQVPLLWHSQQSFEMLRVEGRLSFMEMLSSNIPSGVVKKKGEVSIVNKTESLEMYFICQAMYTKTRLIKVTFVYFKQP